MEETKYGFSLECYQCKLKKYIFNVDLKKFDKMVYVKEQLEKLENAPEEMTSEEFVSLLSEKYNEVVPAVDYGSFKIHYNELMLQRFDSLEKTVNESEDPLKTAMKLAMSSNFIDLGVFDSVDEEELEKLLSEALNKEIDEDVYEKLKQDFSHKKDLLYLSDNCGEIVMDKLFIKKIREYYPDLKVTCMLRGTEVINDASLKDAKEIGLEEVCEITDNGTTLPKTSLQDMPAEKRKLVEEAGMIISKGQANAESLYGCGLNIYYLFLCKCDHFARKYQAHKMDIIIAKER